jgi:hypothetical protein
MKRRIFKVHTDTYGRLEACLKKAMYGVTNTAFTQQMPLALLNAQVGDIVFISEKEVSKNALFGPFYIVADRPPIVWKSRKGVWVNIDTVKTPPREIAYWVEVERKNWCLLFDKVLIDRISIVWPKHWSTLKVNLPSWGIVEGEDADKLMHFASANQEEARDFFKRHGL